MMSGVDFSVGVYVSVYGQNYSIQQASWGYVFPGLLPAFAHTSLKLLVAQQGYGWARRCGSLFRSESYDRERRKDER